MPLSFGGAACHAPIDNRTSSQPGRHFLVLQVPQIQIQDFNNNREVWLFEEGQINEARKLHLLTFPILLQSHQLE